MCVSGVPAVSDKSSFVGQIQIQSHAKFYVLPNAMSQTICLIFGKITSYALHQTIFDAQNPGIGQFIFSGPLLARSPTKANQAVLGI